MLAKIVIPEDVSFSDLKLAHESDGSVSFDWTPIHRICLASGLDLDLFQKGPEQNIGGLISFWYRAHLDDGGQPDPVVEDLIAEADAEDRLGGGISYPPGQA